MARINTRGPSEFLFSVFALIIFTIVVHAAYVTVVRPRATAVLAEQRAAMKKDPNFVAERSIYVVLKDWEQEVRDHPRPLGARDHRLQGVARAARARAARARPRARARGHEDPA